MLIDDVLCIGYQALFMVDLIDRLVYACYLSLLCRVVSLYLLVCSSVFGGIIRRK